MSDRTKNSMQLKVLNQPFDLYQKNYAFAIKRVVKKETLWLFWVERIVISKTLKSCSAVFPGRELKLKEKLNSTLVVFQ